MATFGTIARRTRRKLREYVAWQPITSLKTRWGRCCRAAAVDGRVWLSSMGSRRAVRSEECAIKCATRPSATRVLERGLDSDPVVTRARSASVFCSCSNPRTICPFRGYSVAASSSPFGPFGMMERPVLNRVPGLNSGPTTRAVVEIRQATEERIWSASQSAPLTVHPRVSKRRPVVPESPNLGAVPICRQKGRQRLGGRNAC